MRSGPLPSFIDTTTVGEDLLSFAKWPSTRRTHWGNTLCKPNRINNSQDWTVSIQITIRDKVHNKPQKHTHKTRLVKSSKANQKIKKQDFCYSVLSHTQWLTYAASACDLDWGQQKDMGVTTLVQVNVLETLVTLTVDMTDGYETGAIQRCWAHGLSCLNCQPRIKSLWRWMLNKQLSWIDPSSKKPCSQPRWNHSCLCNARTRNHSRWNL